MQPIWLCLFSGRPFEETFENPQWWKVKQMQPIWLCFFPCKSISINAVMQKAIWADIWKFIQGKSHTSAVNVTMHLLMHGIWGHTWKDTLEEKCTNAKGHTSATNATTQLLRKANWTVISEFTLVKSHTSATNANTHLLTKALWAIMWGITLVKSHTTAANVTTHFLRKAVWTFMWEFTLVKSHTSATNANTQLLRKAIWTVMSEFTLVKSHTSAANANTHLLRKGVWTFIWELTLEKRYTNVKCVLSAATTTTTWGNMKNPNTRFLAHTVNTKLRMMNTEKDMLMQFTSIWKALLVILVTTSLILCYDSHKIATQRFEFREIAKNRLFWLHVKHWPQQTQKNKKNFGCLEVL